MPTAVCVRDLSLTYSGDPIFKQSTQVLNGLNLNVETGSIYGLLGPSGCGKTSLLKCLMSSLVPDSGQMTVFGFKPGHFDSGIPGPGIGYMPQDISLSADLTVKEMLMYFGRVCLVNRKTLSERIDSVLAILDLSKQKTQLIDSLSGGQQRRVSFAAAIIHNPRLLILDEPTVGVDPILRESIWNYLVRLTIESKTTVIITTHYIEETRRAHRVGFMREGQILAEGAPNQLMKQFNSNNLEDVFARLCAKEEEPKQGQIMTPDDDKSICRQPFKYPSGMNPGRRAAIQFEALLIKYFTQFWRHKETISCIFLLPLVFVMSFSVVVGGLPKQIGLGVLNEESPVEFSQLYLNHIDKYIVKQIVYNSLDDAVRDTKAGKIWGFVRIKQNFTDSLTERLSFNNELSNQTIENAIITIHADLTNKYIGALMTRTLDLAFTNFTRAAFRENELNENLGRLPIEVGHLVYGTLGDGDGEDYLGAKDVLLPGLLVMITYTTSYSLGTFVIIEEFAKQMWARSLSAGVSGTLSLFAATVNQCLCIFGGNILILIVSIYMFGASCNGSLFLAWNSLNLLCVAALCHGMILGMLTKNHFNCSILSNGILLFMMTTSGVLWPVEGMPTPLAWLPYTQPVTLPAISLRSILVKGVGLTHPLVYPGLLSSFGFTCFFVTVCFVLVRFMK